MDTFMGFIAAFGFNFAPRDWAGCNGQLLGISDNQALFALLSTFYGGDGRTNFNLPDVRGRTMIGFGQTPGLDAYQIGSRSGLNRHQIKTSQMPSHTHVADVTAGSGGGPATGTLSASTNDGANPQPLQGDYLAATTKGRSDRSNTYIDAANKGTTVTLGGLDISGGGGGSLPTVTNQPTGGTTPIPLMQPFIAINYCIAIQGTFPSRN
ncbi:MAG: tail fiber protein [Rhodospirillales bacterium]|nr:tail fiber protein [Rhodospirillales bacterium]